MGIHEFCRWQIMKLKGLSGGKLVNLMLKSHAFIRPFQEFILKKRISFLQSYLMWVMILESFVGGQIQKK